MVLKSKIALFLIHLIILMIGWNFTANAQFWNIDESIFGVRKVMKQTGIEYLNQKDNVFYISGKVLSYDTMRVRLYNDSIYTTFRNHKFVMHYGEYVMFFKDNEVTLVNDSLWSMPTNIFLADSAQYLSFYYSVIAKFIFKDSYNVEKIKTEKLDTAYFSGTDIYVCYRGRDDRNHGFSSFLGKAVNYTTTEYSEYPMLIVFGNNIKPYYLQWKQEHPTGY